MQEGICLETGSEVELCCWGRKLYKRVCYFLNFNNLWTHRPWSYSCRTNRRPKSHL